MSIKNASNETLDLIIASANPRPVRSVSTSKMLNGDWVTQSFGKSAELLDVAVYCSWAVLQELQGYASTKEQLTISYLDFEKSGHIMSDLDYDIYSRGGVDNRLYSATFELAVIPDV